MMKQLSSKDWTLISSYLDGEISPRDKKRVEEYLKTRPEFLQAYNELKSTRMLLRKAPQRKAPRNFTLSASMVPARARPIPKLVPLLRFSSAITAVLAVVLFAARLLPGFGPALQSAAPVAMAPAAEKEMMSAESAPALDSTSAEKPPVVYWGGPPPLPELAVGGAPCEGGMCGGAPDYAFGKGGGGGGDGNIYPAMPEVPAAAAIPQPTQTSEMGIAEAPAEIIPELSGTGPILGVAPTEQQGQRLEESSTAIDMAREVGNVAQPEGTRPGWLLTAGIALIASALGMFIAATLIRRNAAR